MNLDATDTVALAAAIERGDRIAIAEALNLLDDRRQSARDLAAALLAHLQRAQTIPTRHLIGITGPPGAGKSTLSAALIAVWRQRGQRVGVLAVDPSSPLSGGALLGDRVRMQISAEDDGVFIRSLSNRGELGGLSAEVWPMSLLMLAAFDIVLVETVGVGQGEIDIAAFCDTTCLLVPPGAGDRIQFLKAGILEVPQIIIVNKEDQGAAAKQTLSDIAAVVNKFHSDEGWEVPVLATSATHGSGVATLADNLARHHASLLERGNLVRRRRGYQAQWILRQLAREFGTSGIASLGGEPALLQQLLDTADAHVLYGKFRDSLKAHTK